MHDAADGGILISPLSTVARGFNVSPVAFKWQTIRPSDSNSAGKSYFLEAASLLLSGTASLARRRALLVDSSYEEATRHAARLTLTMKSAAALWLQPRAVSGTLHPAATIERRAVDGFDAPFHVSFSRRPQIAELVQRVGRCNRSTGRGGLLAANHDAPDDTAHVDETEISALVQLVRKVELRRLDRIERQLALAWQRLIEGSRLRASANYFAPSRGESAFRVPMTGACTLTAPPAAS